MDDDIIKRRVGRTPIIRAKNLEKELGIKKIYLKLEGNNPSGHREDRLAYLIIRDALSRAKKTICMGTYGTVGGSLSYLSNYFDVKFVFYMPKRKKPLRKDLLIADNVEIIEFGKTYEDCVKESRRVSKENGWYNANPGLANNMMNMYAFSYIAREINTQLDEKIDTVLCQTSSGSSISGLHFGFKQLWINEEIDDVPKIWAVSTAHGNAIIKSFQNNKREIQKLNPKELKESKYNRNVINWECFNGQDALNALYDLNGRAIAVTDEELINYSKEFRKLEKIKFTIWNSYPIVAFMKEAENHNISDGTHIIILNDGKVNINVRVMNKDDLNISYEEFLNKLDNWLIEFTDPLEEIKEAVENAFLHGYVLCAFDSGVLVGTAIISRTRFETFFPKYHLSYIATSKKLKGMGIATQLLQKAIEISKGDFSLHVETDNKKAIKLYEKMGLKKKYYRMFYQGTGEEY